ncbi:MAG: electron transport complex subunit RsxD [Gammaproteobacteria bacterium]|nr:electron transport complex subunit RsxD [Gammaproteobacteria bacterium]
MSTITSPHLHGPAVLNKVMLQVMLALLPALGVHAWLFGGGILFTVAIATSVALLSEALVLWLRARPIVPTLLDGSAVVTALLLALALPPLAPWWLTSVGVAFAIIFAKQLYGGLGFNPFNPAMVGYVVLLISFPREMTSWLSPAELREGSVTLAMSAGAILGDGGLDTLSGATPLDTLKTRLNMGVALEQIMATQLFGHLGGRGWELVNGMILLGGLWLLFKRVISWHVPVAMLGTLFVTAGLFHLINPGAYASPLFHLFAGGAMLGAFFIATDPVSGATSNRGRLLFGAGAGVLVFVIRSWGGYPDGVAFAVLLMNMVAPTLDYYTRPRVFGQV